MPPLPPVPTVQLNAAVPLAPVPSVTVTVALPEPAAVGVPEIRPEVELTETPPGRPVAA